MNGSMQVEMGRIMLGAVACVAGIFTAGIALLILRRRDPLLISWGAFAFVWGSYLLAGTPAVESGFGGPSAAWRYGDAAFMYLLPIPVAGCFLALLGRGRRDLYLWILRASFVFFPVAILSDLFLSTPGAAIPAGRLLGFAGGLALLGGVFWSGLEMSMDLEWFLAGFVIFALSWLAGLLFPGSVLSPDSSGSGLGLLIMMVAFGFVAARRAINSVRQTSATEQEMETARQIQLSLLPQEIPPLQSLRIAARYVPAGIMGGNFVDSVQAGDGRICVLLGDVGERGVSAAMIASILKVSFASHLPSQTDPAAALAAMNRLLSERTDRKSAAASCLLLDPARRAMTYANAGHPPLLVWRKDGNDVEEIGGSSVVLGPVSGAKYSNTHLPLDPGDRLIMYTSGVTEALDSRGRLFGEKRFRYLVRSKTQVSADQCAEEITQHLLTWTGMGANGELKDDFTVVVVDMLEQVPD